MTYPRKRKTKTPMKCHATSTWLTKLKHKISNIGEDMYQLPESLNVARRNVIWGSNFEKMVGHLKFNLHTAYDPWLLDVNKNSHFKPIFTSAKKRVTNKKVNG